MTTLGAASAELSLEVASRINSEILAMPPIAGKEPVKSTVVVIIPGAAMPGIATVVVLSVADMGEFLKQAPAPDGQSVITAVLLGSFGAGDEPIDLKSFAKPVELRLRIPASALPVGETGQNLVISHWDGQKWNDLVTSTRLIGTDVELSVNLSHFSTYGVLYNGGGAAAPAPKPTASVGAGTFAGTPIFSPTGQAFVVYAGGSSAQLEASAGTAGATGVWVQNSAGRFFLLVVRGPAFLRREFDEAFPAGFAGTTAMTLVR